MFFKIICIVIVGLAGIILAAKPLNVRDFGAVGDGIADDTAAVQKALNLVEKERKALESLYINDYGRIPGWGAYDAPNREIFFPAGDYRITRTLVGAKGVTLSGEKGSVIFTENRDIPIFYFEHFFRGSFRNLTFRGGRNHLYYWSANQDTTSFVVENCRFENSSEYAITSRSYGSLEHAADSADWDRIIACGPFNVTWDGEGMPTLSPATWDCNFANSTKFVVRNCDFIDCAGASDVGTDGTYIADCRFVSTRPQLISPFVGSMSACIYDTEITAAIPGDFTGAYVERFGALINVRAHSTTDSGAPLYKFDKDFRNELDWSFPETILIDNCTVDAAGSPVNAIAYFPKARPVQFTLRNTHEGNARKVKALHFDRVPADDGELMLDCHAASNVPLPPVEFSHSFVFAGNGAEISTELPAIMERFVAEDIPASIRNAFPAAGRAVKPVDYARCTVFDAVEYGIGHEASEHDFANLQKLFDTAGDCDNPLILLPGRRFDLPGVLTLPAQAVIRAEGRTFFHADDETNSIFRITGDDLALELIGCTFDGGTRAVDIAGAGAVRINDCLFYDNRTAIAARQPGADALIVDVDAATVYSPVVLENRGAEVRITDSWISIQATLPEGAALRNLDGGTLVMFNTCGVPVVFSDWPERPNWPYGRDLFWVENHGTFRSTFVRYGGEFGGIPVLDNYGDAKAFIEGQNAHFYHSASGRTFMRNASADATVAVSTISSFWDCVPAGSRAFCSGAAPGALYVASFPEPIGLQLRDREGNRSKIDPVP